MGDKAIQILKEGRKFIDPVMEVNGFYWEAGLAGKSSGGYFASGQYVKGNRKLEMHFRHSLGLVTYQIAEVSLSHEDYMLHAAGKDKARYPGFSSDPLDGFRYLANDLEKLCLRFSFGLRR